MCFSEHTFPTYVCTVQTENNRWPERRSSTVSEIISVQITRLEMCIMSCSRSVGMCGPVITGSRLVAVKWVDALQKYYGGRTAM